MEKQQTAAFANRQNGKTTDKLKSTSELADDTALVEALLYVTDWQDDRIAAYAKVTVAFVENVKVNSDYRRSRTGIISDRIIREEAVLERNTIFVGNLLRYTGFPIDKIASLAGVSIPFVTEIKADLRM